jgi:TRAP-type C4-dicarboxylate transport system substrate-binding protein
MKKVLIVAMVLTLAFSLTAAAAAEDKQVYKWKVCMGLSKYKGHQPVDDFLKAVEEATDGRLQFQYLQPGEHPYSPVDVMKAVKDNVMQIGFTLSIYTQSIFPQMGLQDLPFMFSADQNEFLAMTMDPEFKDIWDYVLLDPLDQYNQMLMGWFANPGYMFAGPKWVDDFNSWDGLRIRIYSKPMGEMIKLFGAVPVNVSWNEVSTALQRNMIDGFLTATTGAYGAKLYEFPSVKWVTMVDWAVGVSWISMNKKAFEELPKDLQEKVLAACKEQQPILQQAYRDIDYMATSNMMRYYGVKCKFMDPKLIEQAREKMQPIWQEHSKNMGPNAEEIIDRINKFHTKYMKTRKVQP